MKLIFSLLLLLFLSPTIFAQLPTINAEHPRIWIGANRITDLQERILEEGEAKDLYDEVVNAYNNWWITDPQLYIAGSDSTQWTWTWASQFAYNQYLMTIFLYKMTEDPVALMRCRFLARKIIEHIDGIDFDDYAFFEREELLRNLSNMNILFDQCYDDLPVSLRGDLAQRLFRVNEIYMDTYILSESGNSYVSSHNTWNTIIVNQNVLSLYDADELTEEQQATVRDWYEVIYDKLSNEFIPCWTYYRDDDGGWNWGASYAMNSLIDQFQLFENMFIGTDKNYYADLPWVQNSINQYYYFNQPNFKSIHLGDGQSGMLADRVMYLHSRHFDDPRGQWMIQYWSQPDFINWTVARFYKLFYKNFDMPVVEHPDLALNWWSDKVGLSVSRSSWADTATMVTFFNSPSKRAAHEHRDNNSFAVFRHAPLLLDAGYFDQFRGAHYNNYYTRTIAHNSVCVYDPEEEFVFFEEPIANDGGQVESKHLKNYDEIFLPENQRGEWLKYAAEDNYAYNVADAQLSYNPEKVSLFRRRFLYHQSNRIIVLDHLHLIDAQSRQLQPKWLAHFANRPEMEDLVETEVVGHIETFAGQNYSAVNGGGSVAIKTLLPEATTTRLIGGEGYEYWVDGENYPIVGELPEDYATAGSWRIEVEPTVVRDSMVYFHAIAIGDAEQPIDASDVVGVQTAFTIGGDWGDVLYFFSADGSLTTNRHLLVDVAGNRALSLFALDLEAGNYEVLVNGVLVDIVNADENGLVETNVNLTTEVATIEIINQVLSVDEQGAASKLKLLPNPARESVRFEPPEPNMPFEAALFSIDGRELLREIKTTTISLQNLPAGIYWLRVQQQGVWYQAKLTKL